MIGASGLLINNTLTSFWKIAYHQQRKILVDIREHFPVLFKELHRDSRRHLPVCGTRESF